MHPLSFFTGLFGIAGILLLAYGLSSNRNRIDKGLVLKGLLAQILMAIVLLKWPPAQWFFQQLGGGIEQLLAFADKGAGFVFGGMVTQPKAMETLFGAGGSFIFAIKLLASIILVASLVSIAYYLGLLQAIVKGLAWSVSRFLGVSGAEALSNSASVFVGQVEAQLLVKPYLSKATSSELLAMMGGSMACISGGTLAIYVSMGVPAHYLLTASLMSIPGALVIAKILKPETEEPLTRSDVRLDVPKQAVNVIDAAAQGALEGGHIAANVIVVLIAFISLLAMVDAGVAALGSGLLSLGVAPESLGLSAGQSLSVKHVLGGFFQGIAWALGVPDADTYAAGSMMGTKLVLNEFVAYSDMTKVLPTLQPKTVAILSMALCGFANFGSVAIQLGGIGTMIPERKSELARLGLWALLVGTLASYLSGAMAGLLMGIGT
jgi:concentrative nucleoside transporter, CNT family